MASRKSGLTALSFNCGSQEPNNIILVKDNSLPADLTSKGYFGPAFHCVRHGTCSSCAVRKRCSRFTTGAFFPFKKRRASRLFGVLTLSNVANPNPPPSPV
jgi:hypothetical protein